MVTNLTGPIFEFTYNQLQSAVYTGSAQEGAGEYAVSTLDEVLEKIGGRVGLEIEIKGPELASVEIIGAIMNRWQHIWKSVEITSFEPMLLHCIKQTCLGITVDLLIPPSEPWMDLDVVAYQAIHRGRLSGARAAHLHPTQLTKEVVQQIRGQGLEVHSWDINDSNSLELISDMGIPKFTTDKLQMALDFRDKQTRGR